MSYLINHSCARAPNWPPGDEERSKLIFFPYIYMFSGQTHAANTYLSKVCVCAWVRLGRVRTRQLDPPNNNNEPLFRTFLEEKRAEFLIIRDSRISSKSRMRTQLLLIADHWTFVMKMIAVTPLRAHTHTHTHNFTPHSITLKAYIKCNWIW